MKKFALTLMALLLMVGCASIATAEEQLPSPYELGEQAYASGDYASAIEWYEQAAEQGHSHAMFRLGMIYGDSSLMYHDVSKALMWYQQAYEHFNFFAIHAIVDLCDDAAEIYGIQFYQEIVSWFEKVSVYGDASVLYQLGRFYFDETYAMQDLTKAAYYFEKQVATEENAHALFYLYQIYHNPDFPEVNEAKAAEWLERAANAGKTEAMEMMQMQRDEKLEERISTESKYAMMQVVQPFLEKIGVLEPCPECAILAWEETVYLSVSPLEVSPVEHEGKEFPTTYFHKTQDCEPGLIHETNFLTIRFWGADQVIRPCPVCMPESIKLLIRASNEKNGKINFSIGFFDQVGDDKQYKEQFVIQLEPDTYEILSVGTCIKLIEVPNMYSLRPVYKPLYLAAPYETIYLVETCPCCYGGNFEPEDWEDIEGEWVYCVSCGNIWETAYADLY